MPKYFAASPPPVSSPLPLVLASASPRRRHLLGLLGMPFSVVASTVDESTIGGNSPLEFAQNAAREKCLNVASDLKTPSLVLAADTVVCFDLNKHPGEPSPTHTHAFEERCLLSKGFRLFSSQQQVVLGKPSGPEEAAEMLRCLSGRTHHVTTAIALWNGSPNPEVQAETSEVRFRVLSEREIQDYVASGEALDKAGAYAVQKQGARLVRSVRGDLSNVIGMPLPLVIHMLLPYYPHIGMPKEEDLMDAYRL